MDSGSKKPARLFRSLGLTSAFIIVISNMIGTGIFTTSGFIIQKIQNPYSLLLAWIVGGILALCGALCYGELGAMFPEAGGDYVFLREAFGKSTGFLSGWISLIVGFSAPAAATAAAFGGYMHKTLPLAWQQAVSPTGLAIAAILSLSAIHISGLKAGSRIQNSLGAFNLSMLAFLLIAGFLSPKGSFQNFGHSLPSPLSFCSESFFSSCVLISFAFSGWNAVAYIGGEIKTPERNIPYAIIGGTLFVTGLYLTLNILFVYAAAPAQLAGVQEVGRLAADILLGERAGTLFSAGISVILLSCLGSMIVIGPRVYYAMGRDKVFFEKLGAVNPRLGTPINAILLQAALAVILVLTSTFLSLLIYIGSVITLFACLTVFALVRLRSRQPDLARPYKTWGYPLTPFVFIAGNLCIVFFCFRDRPVIAFWGAVTLLSGLLVYQFFRKKSNA